MLEPTSHLRSHLVQSFHFMYEEIEAPGSDELTDMPRFISRRFGTENVCSLTSGHYSSYSSQLFLTLDSKEAALSYPPHASFFLFPPSPTIDVPLLLEIK